MPRLKRSQLAAAVQAVRLPSPEPPSQADRGRHATRVRARCVVCGMMPELFRLASSPFPAELYLQRFGGGVAATEGRPAQGYMVYEFAGPEKLVDYLGLYLLLLEEARAVVVELLPDVYRDAGLPVPPEVEAADLPRILGSLPPREVLLERLLAEDTIWKVRRAG